MEANENNGSISSDSDKTNNFAGIDIFVGVLAFSMSWVSEEGSPICATFCAIRRLRTSKQWIRSRFSRSEEIRAQRTSEKGRVVSTHNEEGGDGLLDPFRVKKWMTSSAGGRV